MAYRRQIEGLPEGWVWVSKGQGTWTTSKGELSDERHGHNAITGENLSVRQVQNRQRTAREEAGEVIPPTVPRRGRIRTIRGERNEQQRSLYAPEIRGKVENYVFRSLEDARNFVMLNGLPDWAAYGMLQVRFTERLVATNKTGSDKVGKRNGYASLTGFASHDQLVDGANPVFESRGFIRNPWDIAEENIKNYDMSGSRARVYLYLAERGQE